MATASQFDLNNALQLWLDGLAQSPQFKAADLAELESHVRDSVNQLQTQGLSSEESFLVATRRVGGLEKLEPEFAKVNRSPRLIVIHLLILAFFSVSCWCLWAWLKVSAMAGMGGRPLPAFTVLMASNRSLLLIPPVVAAAYCLWASLRRDHSRAHWVGFFACTAAVLLLLMFPTIIALLLPLIDGVNQFHGR